MRSFSRFNYSGLRGDGTGTPRCLLYRGPYKPPLGIVPSTLTHYSRVYMYIYIYSLVHDVVHGSMAQAGTTWNPVLNSAVENGQDQADQVGCDKKARVISISFVLTSASSSIAVFVCTLAVCCSAGCSTSWTGTTGRRPLPRPRSFQNETCRVIVYE